MVQIQKLFYKYYHLSVCSLNKLGGDSELTECGVEYSRQLGAYINRWGGNFVLPNIFSTLLNIFPIVQCEHGGGGGVDQLAPEDHTDGPAHTRPPGEVSQKIRVLILL